MYAIIILIPNAFFICMSVRFIYSHWYSLKADPRPALGANHITSLLSAPVVYKRGSLGSGAHGNHYKHFSVATFSLLVQNGAQRARIVVVMAFCKDQYYERIGSIQQSMHER